MSVPRRIVAPGPSSVSSVGDLAAAWPRCEPDGRSWSLTIPDDRADSPNVVLTGDPADLRDWLLAASVMMARAAGGPIPRLPPW